MMQFTIKSIIFTETYGHYFQKNHDILIRTII